MICHHLPNLLNGLQGSPARSPLIAKRFRTPVQHRSGHITSAPRQALVVSAMADLADFEKTKGEQAGKRWAGALCACVVLFLWGAHQEQPGRGCCVCCAGGRGQNACIWGGSGERLCLCC